MSEYQHSKLNTIKEIYQKIENWWTAIDLRIRRGKKRFELIRFRDGTTVVCRGGTRDWDVIHELFFAGGYGMAMDFLRRQKGNCNVIDLGGNIGLFSILAATANPAARVFAFEPGPPNFELFEVNRLLNPKLSSRIHLTREAVAGTTGVCEWRFDADNPGGSGLFAAQGDTFKVQVRALTEVLAQIEGRIDLLKIDIEGAEYSLIEGTPSDSWKKISAISLEVHEDPSGKSTPQAFLKRLESEGFKVEQESVVSYFLTRA